MLIIIIITVDAYVATIGSDKETGAVISPILSWLFHFNFSKNFTEVINISYRRIPFSEQNIERLSKKIFCLA